MANVTKITVPYKKAVEEKKRFIYVDTFKEKDTSFMEYIEKFFDDVEDLVEYCSDRELDIPTIVYGVIEETIYISAENALEDACMNFNGHLEDFSSSEIEELQGILDSWVKERGRKYYSKDPFYLIDISKEIEELLEKWEM